MFPNAERRRDAVTPNESTRNPDADEPNKYLRPSRSRMASIIQNFVDMAGYFIDVAFAFPSSILLVAIGLVLITLPSLFVAYLAAGAAVDLVMPESIGRTPQQRG